MTGSLIFLIGITILGQLLSPAAAIAMVGGGAGNAHLKNMYTDRLIVKFRITGLQPAETALLNHVQVQEMNALAGISMRYIRPMSDHAHVLKLPYKMTVSEVKHYADALKRGMSISYAVPDVRVYPMLVPNDPLYAKQWHYKSSVKNGMNLPGAWDITTGSRATVIAVIDTGILPHADLNPARIVPGYDFIADLVTANDGDGRDPDPTDPGDWAAGIHNSTWHGTHVAGTIGAWTNNGTGVAGVDWQGKILPLRVLGVGGGWSSDVVDAIVWAAGRSVPGVPANANPAQVINMSLGGSGTCSPVWQNAINTAVSAGVTVVVSAGNAASDAALVTPASCTNVITVAAHNNMSVMSYYSNFGATVEIMAPGGEQFFSNDPGGVLSTLDGGKTVARNDNIYTFYQGTSMAAPHISGLVALMRAVNPSLTPLQISTAIQTSARQFVRGGVCISNPGRCGGGIADARAAVLAVKQPLGPSGLSATVVSDTKIHLAWTDNAINETGFKIERAGIGGGYQQIATVVANVASFVDATAAEGRTYFYRIRAFHAYADSGYSGIASATTFPATPGTITTVALSPTQVDLNWIDNSAAETGFIIERSTVTTGYIQVATTAANSTFYRDTGLSPLTTYHYRVRAFNASGKSAYSPVSAVTTAGAVGAGSFGLTSLILMLLLWGISASFSYQRL